MSLHLRSIFSSPTIAPAQNRRGKRFEKNDELQNFSTRPAKNAADHDLIFGRYFVNGKQKRELWQLSGHAEAHSASSEKSGLFWRDPHSASRPRPASDSRQDIVYIRHLSEDDAGPRRLQVFVSSPSRFSQFLRPIS
jgi:hypothetical protein